MAKIMPCYLAVKQAREKDPNCYLGEIESASGRKNMCIRLSGNEVFPAGTPKWINIGNLTVEVFRGEVNHFHMTDNGDSIPYGWDVDGYALVRCKRLGSGRQALQKFLKMFPPIDKQVQAFNLRQLVRSGD